MIRAGQGGNGVLLVAVVLASLMQSIDTTVATVALPQMQASLNGSPDTINWVLTSYIVAAAVATPATGWLSERVGIRRLFLAVTIGFTVASIACGLARSVPEMALYRFIQGVFGAYLSPLGQTVLLSRFPRASHGRVMAIWGVGVMFGPVIGPVVGGWLTDNADWRWVFLINIPVGALAFAGLWSAVPQVDEPSRKFDMVGFSLLALGLVSLQLMLDRGAALDWFESPEILIEAGIAVSCFWMFSIHLFGARHPLYAPAMLADANLSMGMGFMVLFNIIMMAGIAMLPPMLQHLFGYSAMDAGLLMAPRGLATMVTMLFISAYGHRLEPRLVILVGVGTFSFALWLMQGFSLGMDGRLVLVACLLQGFGMGLVFTTAVTMAFRTVPQAHIADAAGLFSMVRHFGGAIGIAVTSARWTHDVQVNHEELGARLSEASLPIVPWLDRFAQYGSSAMTMLDAEVNRQAAMIAYLNQFRLLYFGALLLAAIAVAMIFRSAPGNQQARSEAVVLD